MASQVNFEKKAELDEVFASQLGWTGQIKYGVDYALYVEHDTAYAGSEPPFDPIHQWVQRNWNDIDTAIKRMARDGRDTLSEAEHMEVTAWIIVNSIADSGIEGIHFGARSLEHGKAKADTIVAKYAGSDDPEATKHIAEEITQAMFEKSQNIIESEANDTGELKDSGSFVVEKRSGSE